MINRHAVQCVSCVSLGWLLLVCGCGSDVEYAEVISNPSSDRQPTASHTIEVRVMNAKAVQPCHDDGEIFIDIFREGEVVASYGKRVIPEIFEKPQLGGDIVRFAGMSEGVYLVRVIAMRHVDVPQECEFWTSENKSPTEDLEKRNKGEDNLGTFVITNAELLKVYDQDPLDDQVTTKPKRYRALITKRYYMAFPTWTWTHVAEHERTDYVLAVVPVPIDDSFGEGLRKFTITEGANLPLDHLLEGQSPFLKAGSGAVVTVVVSALTDLDGLLTRDGLGDLAVDVTTGTVLTLTFGAANLATWPVSLTILVVSKVAVELVETVKMIEHGFSDDFTADAQGWMTADGTSSHGQVVVHNKGCSLFRVKIQAEISADNADSFGPTLTAKLELADGTGWHWLTVSTEVRWIDHLKQETLEWDISPETLKTIGQDCRLTGRLRLRYVTEPQSGVVTKQSYQLIVFGLEEQGDSILRIVSIRPDVGRALDGKEQPACVAAVKSFGKEPVRLFLLEPRTGTKYSRKELAMHKRQNPRLKVPYGLGMEMRHKRKTTWDSFGVASRIWVPLVRPSGYDRYETVSEVTIGPGETQEFFILVAGGLLPVPGEVRVFITDPTLSRVEEKSMQYHLQ